MKLLGLLLFASLGFGQIVSSGLIAEYKFTDGSGTTLTDSSGNANNGTLVNTPTWVAGEGLTFNQASSQYVTLPAGISASVKTIQIFGNFDSNYDLPCAVRPLLGSTSAQTSGLQIIFGDCTVTSGVNGRLTSWHGSSIVDETAENIQRKGPQLLTVVWNSGADTFYFNSTASALYYTQTGVAPSSGSDGFGRGTQFELMGNSGASQFASGTVYWVALYSTALTAGNVSQNYTYASGVLTGNGISLSTSYNTQKINLICDGDSITFGAGGVNPYCGQVAPKWVVINPINYGIGSQSTDHMVAGATGKVDPLDSAGSLWNLSLVFGGTNDMIRNGSSSRTPAQVLASLQSYCTARRSAGFKCIVVTMASRTGTGQGGSTMDSLKNTLNGLITGSPSSWDAIADVGADSHMGCDGCYSNATYFQVDGIHPTNTGQTIIAGLVAGAVDKITQPTQSKTNSGQVTQVGVTQ